MEVYAAPESTTDADYSEEPHDGVPATDPERDHLAELEDLLECVGDLSAGVGGDRHAEPVEDEYRQVRYDLCGGCRKRMLANPLGRLAMSKIDFSDN